MLDSIFTSGWGLNVLLYGFVFLLGQYAVYKIIFNAIVGAPQSYHFEDQRHWYRKTIFLGAVIFAPVFEEIMFTFLAYKSFLSYAVVGKEGVVILFVAIFFALLHLPGDLLHLRYQLSLRNLYLLTKYQLNRFFFSLTAYFIFQMTGQLWVTITLHYFFNAVVSFYNFDLEDRSFTYNAGDGHLLLIKLLNLSFAFFATYIFYQHYPQLVWYFIPLTGFILIDFVRVRSSHSS